MTPSILTEAAIEYRVERQFDIIDSLLMGGKLSQKQYDKLAKKINAWANSLYAARAGRA